MTSYDTKSANAKATQKLPNCGKFALKFALCLRISCFSCCHSASVTLWKHTEDKQTLGPPCLFAGPDVV